MGWNPHSVAELPVVHLASNLYPQVWTTYTSELSSSSWLLYFKYLSTDRVVYLLSNSTACLCTLNCSFAQVLVHNSVFIVTGGFYKLASCMSWVASNGIKDDQHRFYCISIFMTEESCYIWCLNDLHICDSNSKISCNYFKLFYLWYVAIITN